ncbi:MAG: hypothetical protein Q9160_006336 [Pyrenula sp. 1 TL-2023]
MRPRRSLTALALLIIFIASLLFLRSARDPFFQNRPEAEPLPPATTLSHPILQLITGANKAFDEFESSQSKTLSDAVAEYRKRYLLPPPPHFDRWFAFANKRRVRIKDDYDTIYNSILPFWAVEPRTLRERVRESLGFDNGMIGVMIRGGSVVKIEGGGDGVQWHRDALEGMLKDFVQWLPDMDLAFNVHDEPRVVVQSDDLDRHVREAKQRAAPVSFSKASLKNGWSKRPDDLGDGIRIKDYRTSRFNKFAHQPVWSNARMSCPIDTAARSLNESAADDSSTYAQSPLGFIHNVTALADICNSPSLQRTFGFMDRPNAFNIVHDLFPVFSQSKISSFQDIIYPSPWYWADRARYDNTRDTAWENKQGKIFWRGSTTGGFSRDGGWRRQHRQIFVQKVNKPDQARILVRDTNAGSDHWTEKEIPRAETRDLFDIRFTYVGQCDPGDCDAQHEYFDIVDAVDMYDAYGYKYLLDIDGNAFSGRYYSFLLSNSLVYKLALFREWHDEWLKPWVHYVPLGLAGDEYVESVRYFEQEEEGRMQAKRLAESGKDWAEEVLRKQDMEVWFFRLLLE